MALTNDVAVCNLALDRVRKPHIQSLEETTQEADVCKGVYTVALEELLTMHDWAFASIVLTLTKHSEDPPSDWAFRYSYPGDCLRPIGIVMDVDVRNHEVRPFTVELIADGTSRSILSDTGAANLRYTKNITDLSLMTPIFKQTLVWKVAMEIAVPLTGNTQIFSATAQAFTRQYSAAVTIENNTRYTGPQPDAQSIRARG